MKLCTLLEIANIQCEWILKLLESSVKNLRISESWSFSLVSITILVAALSPQKGIDIFCRDRCLR